MHFTTQMSHTFVCVSQYIQAYVQWTTNLRYYLVHNIGISSGALFLSLCDGGLQISSILFLIGHLPAVINMCTVCMPEEVCETLLEQLSARVYVSVAVCEKLPVL